MAGPDHGVDVAAGVEIGLQLHPDRSAGRHEVIQIRFVTSSREIDWSR